tara:strand:+ start:605 stop:1021 length:417 start_codon:yes stop_codon:yes gene_type:complete
MAKDDEVSGAKVAQVASLNAEILEAQRTKDPNLSAIVAKVNKAKDAIKTEVGTEMMLRINAAASNPKSKGGDISKKVPVISIGVGMAEMRKGKKGKTAMMRGGMANGKEHMYAAGGVVNDGLKALAKTRPDVVAKILK